MKCKFTFRENEGTRICYLDGDFNENNIIVYEIDGKDSIINEYFHERLPGHLKQEFMVKDSHDYLNGEFTFRCPKYGERRMSVGDLIFGVARLRRFSHKGMHKKRIFRILDWFIIHNLPRYLTNDSGNSLINIYRTFNMFHNSGKIEREILNLIVNKGLIAKSAPIKIEPRLEEIKLFTTFDSITDIKLDKNYCLSEHDAVYIGKYYLVEGRVAEFVKLAENKYIVYDRQTNAIKLSQVALKTSLIVNFIMENNIFSAVKSPEVFKKILHEKSVERIEDFISYGHACQRFIEELDHHV